MRYWMNVYHVESTPTFTAMNVNHQGVRCAMNNGTSIPRERTITSMYVNPKPALIIINVMQVLN